MKLAMRISEQEHSMLIAHEVHFWTLSKTEEDFKNDKVLIVFPDEAEYTHAQLLVSEVDW